MEKKQNLSHIKKKKIKIKDPCPICDKDLSFSNNFSKRIGLFDMKSLNHRVIGWACPYCESEFDKRDNIMYIYGSENIQGDT